MKEMKMGCAGHVACMRDVHMKFWSENIKGRDHLEDLHSDGRVWTGFI